MQFSDIERHINDSHRKRTPQGLSEMAACVPLAQYLNDRFGSHYDDISKENQLDNEGVDVVLTDTTNKYPHLYIQVTHAREYDMTPTNSSPKVDMSGYPILSALQAKCKTYIDRGIYTKQIILLIQGVIPTRRATEIFRQYGFVDRIIEESCFDGVYYVSDSVYPLKQIRRPDRLNGKSRIAD